MNLNTSIKRFAGKVAIVTGSSKGWVNYLII